MTSELSGQLGKVHERYRFLAKLGSGGMADVFLGVQHGAEDFQRLVVIKRVHSAWLQKENAMKMFINEARIVAALNHPHIVKIYDLSRMGRDICIAMEYVDGENLEYLRKSIRKRNLSIPLPIICKLMAEACEALHYAHSAKTSDGEPLNLIHRDIGPHNLMIDSSGYLKVIDFGIAKSTAQTEMTSPGMIKGKFSYLAPDLFRFKDIDGRVDLYALGLVFYELVTLKRTYNFKKDVTVAEVLQRISSENLPQVSSLMPELPKEIDDIVNKAVEKDRDVRYLSGHEFASDIRKFGEIIGGLATTNQVEEWYKDNFSERIARRREFERQAMQKASQQRPALTKENNQPIVTHETVNISDISQMQSPSSVSGASGMISNTSQIPGKRVNPYIFMAVLFVMVVGGAFLFKHLFWTDIQHTETIDKSSNVDGHSDNLHISSEPTGADIFIDSHMVGFTGAHGLSLKVKPGQTHTVVLRKEGYEEYTLEVPGESFGQRKIEAKLREIPQKAAPAPKAIAKNDAEESKSRKRNKRRKRPRRKSHSSPSELAQKDVTPVEDANKPTEDPQKDNTRDDAMADSRQAQVTETEKVPEQPDEDVVDTPDPEQKTEVIPPKPDLVPPLKVARIQVPQEPVFVSNRDALKRRIAGKQPVYPSIAQRRGKKGKITVKVFIGVDGSIIKKEFIKDDPAFNTAVNKALNRWRFKPLMVAGQPVESYTIFSFSFK
jgi:serine/threonine-protein kinase